MTNGLNKYTRDEIAKMCQTMTVPEIASLTGGSPKHMYEKIANMGIEIKKAEPKQCIGLKYKADIEVLSKTKTLTETARALCITVDSLSRAAKKLGIIFRKHVHVPAKGQEIKIMSKKTSGTKSVVNARHVNPNKVKKVVTNNAKDLDDIRNLMARPVYDPNGKTISTRY